MNRRTKHDHITEGWTLSGQFSLTQSPGSATGAPCRPVTVTYGEIGSKLLPFSRSLAYQFHVSQPFNLDSKLEFLAILDIDLISYFKKKRVAFLSLVVVFWTWDSNEGSCQELLNANAAKLQIRSWPFHSFPFIPSPDLLSHLNVGMIPIINQPLMAWSADGQSQSARNLPLKTIHNDPYPYVRVYIYIALVVSSCLSPPCRLRLTRMYMYMYMYM